jgi:hypothetical protein
MLVRLFSSWDIQARRHFPGWPGRSFERVCMRNGAAGAVSFLALVLALPDSALPQDRSAAPAAPPVLLLDGAHLAAARARLRAGDERLRAAVARLEADAQKALAIGPLSVMDKLVSPPSGDKHDYMSQAPYWWPNPDTADGLPYIRRDGDRNPDISRISDRDNLGRLAGAVSTLGLAFYMTGREEYAAHARRLVRVWFLEPATRMNPHLRFGQGIPGITDGRGIGIIETRLLTDLVDGVLLVDGSRAWTDEDAAGLKAWMREYVTWLVESPHGQEEARNGNNHETWYDVQVATFALYAGDEDLARNTLLQSRERIGRQIEPDGRQPRELERTRAWDYSIFNLSAFLHLAALGDRLGVDLWNHRTSDGRSLRQALDFLVPFATGARRFEEAQITEFRAGALYPLLRRAAIGWQAPRYRELAERIGGGNPRLDVTLP